MQINCRNVQLIILLILNILLEVILCVVFITLRFNITLLSFIEMK